MRHKFGLWVAFLAFFSFFAALTPGQAFASNADTISKMCDDGSFDIKVQNNRTLFQQQLLNHAQQVSQMYPIATAASQCLTQLAKLMRDLPSLSNPFDSLTGSLISSIIAGIISQVCSAVMQTIQSAEQALTSFTKICIPLPNFGSLSGFTFQQQPCDGAAFNTLSGGFAGNPPQPSLGFGQYQSH